MKTFYLFDEITKECLGTYDAQESPLEDGVYIAPNCSTDIEPNIVEEGKYNYWNDSNWELKDDTRGIWYKADGSTVKVASLLDEIDTSWSRVKPEPTNEQKISLLKSQILDIEYRAIMPRGAREAFIVLCQQQGAAAGLSEPQLYAANPFYRGLKDTDAIAADLRAQIKALS